MTQPTAVVERLTARLAECPPVFLAEPKTGRGDGVHVDAVVGDLLVALGAEQPSKGALKAFRSGGAPRRNTLRLVLITSWLLHDEVFTGHGRSLAGAARHLLEQRLEPLGALVAADLFVTDPDRREELVRVVLHGAGFLPEGETASQAEDRLQALDSVERDRVIRAMRAKEEAARRKREAMRRQAAEEAAARYSRE